MNLNPFYFFAIQPVWNNDETVFKSLKSLDNFCTNIIILEGKWIGYEGEIRSKDNTVEEIQRFIKQAKSKVELIQLPIELHQYEARNILLSKVSTGNYFISLDSDEIMEKYPTRERLQDLINEWLKLNVKGSCIYSYDETQEDIRDGHLMDLPKIHLKQDGMHYTHNHRYIDIGDKPLIYNSKDFPACKDFCFIHKGLHKRTRQQAEEYKNWLLNWEWKNKNW